jgi:sn1-specific diacylglycerol lipase
MQFIAVRKTLEANMHMTDLFPPGRVLWALRDSDLHPSHRLSTSEHTKGSKSSGDAKETGGQDKLRLFEVLDVEKVFSQIVFAKDMLRYGTRSLFQEARLLKYSSQCTYAASI